MHIGGDNREDSCIPFVSEYNDCTQENQCNGCTKCVCAAEGRWSCQTVRICPGQEPEDVDYNSINNALYEIQNSLENINRHEAATSKTPLVPRPPEQEPDLLLDYGEKDLDFDIASMLRNKRSVDIKNNTEGIKFYHTVDEINEDTLKSGNDSGTLQVHKFETNPPKISRRHGVLTTDNTSMNSLHIAYNEQKVYEPHLADNKIDAVHHNDQDNTIIRSEMLTIVTNHTQKQKDKDLSKLIVNELKPGKEIIGDENGKVMSNITFTPENDTLTAMAFIAGNLLNKLWNMEKDSGEDSIETEVLKHEKISDLLDLFKEPLNLRQENFLKSALEQLSEAINQDRNLKNVSLCEKIESTKKLLREANSSSEEVTTKEKGCIKGSNTEISAEKPQNISTEAITKVNNVLSLISKFQEVQKNLYELKQKPSDSKQGTATNKIKLVKEPTLSQNKESSLNIFGNVLEKITNLLMPPKKSKKFSKGIRNQNVLKNSKGIANTLKHLYNIDIESSELSAKDKLIVDYLSTVRRNPKCLLENLKETNQSPITKAEGDILLNLSEFFKVKSFIDLIKLLEPESKTNVRSDITTTKVPEVTTETTTTITYSTTKASKNLADTKEKLKAHLKTILDDLVEIQNAKGHPTNKISIMDALPCIYKIMNADKDKQDTFKPTTISPVDKVVTIFNSLKKDLISTQTRRSNVVTENRPKSAVVWERIVKNVDNKNKQSTRRNLEIKEPKTFDELKKLMDQTESTSKTYKNQALINGVPPSERLVLLKTLFEDVKTYIDVLEDIDNSMSNLESISVEKKTDVKDFVDNAATNINLNERIAKNINNLKPKTSLQRENTSFKKPREEYVQKQSMKLLDVNPSYERNNVKLSRDSIINQLIKNRMQLFIKIKESQKTDLESDINYSIAKKILSYLESGNYTIARELYKVIVSQKHKLSDVSKNQQSGQTSGKKSPIFSKMPVVQFEDPQRQNQVSWMNQDVWLRQLSNLKNLRA